MELVVDIWLHPLISIWVVGVWEKKVLALPNFNILCVVLLDGFFKNLLHVFTFLTDYIMSRYASLYCSICSSYFFFWWRRMLLSGATSKLGTSEWWEFLYWLILWSCLLSLSLFTLISFLAKNIGCDSLWMCCFEIVLGTALLNMFVCRKAITDSEPSTDMTGIFSIHSSSLSGLNCKNCYISILADPKTNWDWSFFIMICNWLYLKYLITLGASARSLKWETTKW